MNIFRRKPSPRHKTITPSPFFVRVVKPALSRILPRMYNIKVVESVNLKSIHPPYILMGNHVNFWDPFFLGIHIDQTPQFVTSDNVFRTRFFGLAMKLLGSIPKSKFMSDAATVAQIVRIIRRGGVIGIFPEGRRTWDGRGLDHVPQVSKLVHRLGLPVIGVKIKGGHLAKPRWSRYRLRGRVELEYFQLFSAEELASLDWAATRRLMEERLFHDDIAWARDNDVRFLGKAPAEYIEKALYLCPSCEGVATFHSSGDTAECGTCGYAFRYNFYGMLEPVSGPLRFSELAEWNSWQSRRLVEKITEETAAGQVFMEEGPSTLLVGYRAQRLKKLHTGRAQLTPDTLFFRTTLGEGMAFPITELEAVNVQNREKLEFYHKGKLYRLNFVNPRVSALLWHRALTGVQQWKLERNSGSLSADGDGGTDPG